MITELISELKRSGIQIWLDGDQLRYRTSGPKSAVAQLERVRERKNEIIHHLSQQRERRRISAHSLLETPWHLLETCTEPNGSGLLAPLPHRVEHLWKSESFAKQVNMNLPFAMVFQEPVDAGRVKEAIAILVQRHESLRTTLALVDDCPIQRIHATADFDVEMRNLLSRDAANRTSIAAELSEFVNRPFDLYAGPIFRAGLNKLGDGTTLFAMVIHHYFADAWSLNILAAEFIQLYRRLVSSNNPNFLGKVESFANYSWWQRRDSESRLERNLDYWTKRLDGAQPVCLPPTTSRTTNLEESVLFDLGADLGVQLDAIARSENSTISNVLLCAFQAAISHWSGSSDVTTAQTLSARSKPQFNSTVGYLVGAVPVRTIINAEMGFSEFVRRASVEISDSHLFRGLSAEAIEEIFDPDKPICQTMFNYSGPSRLSNLQNIVHDPTQEAIQFYNLSGALRSISPHIKVRREMCLRVGSDGRRVIGSLDYNMDTLDRKQVDTFLQLLKGDLYKIVANPDIELGSLFSLKSN